MTTDKPTVDLNLDSYSPEKGDPYGVVLGGKRYELTHLDELDGWQFIESLEQGDAVANREILRLALGDDFAEFRKKPLPKAKLDHLVKGYLTHCGVELGNSDS